MVFHRKPIIPLEIIGLPFLTRIVKDFLKDVLKDFLKESVKNYVGFEKDFLGYLLASMSGFDESRWVPNFVGFSLLV